MYRPADCHSEGRDGHPFSADRNAFCPPSPSTSTEGGDGETARDGRDKQSGKSRVKKAAYAAVPAQLRGGPSLAKLVDKLSEIDGLLAINAGDAGLASTDPAPSHLRAFAYSAARAFERTQARSRFSFGTGGLAFLDPEIQCDTRSR